MTTAAATLTVLPAAADEVSASIAHLFSGHATEYQKLAGKAAAFHDQFVQHLTASASAYASAEAANTALLQLLTAIAGSVASVSAGLQDQLGNLLQDVLDSTTLYINGIPIGFIFDPSVFAIFLLLIFLSIFYRGGFFPI